MVGDGPVDSGDNPRSRTTSVAAQNTNWNECDGFGYSVSCATNGSRNMGAVSVAIGGSAVIANGRVARNKPCAKFTMWRNAGVNNIGSDASTIRAINV